MVLFLGLSEGAMAFAEAIVIIGIFTALFVYLFRTSAKRRVLRRLGRRRVFRFMRLVMFGSWFLAVFFVGL